MKVYITELFKHKDDRPSIIGVYTVKDVAIAAGKLALERHPHHKTQIQEYTVDNSIGKPTSFTTDTKSVKKLAVKIYTYGDCINNKGAWSAILQYGLTEKEISGNANNTTKSEMEILAVMKSIELLTRPLPVILFTESSYLRNAIIEKVEPQEYKKLLNQLITDLTIHQVTWEWSLGQMKNRVHKLVTDLLS